MWTASILFIIIGTVRNQPDTMEHSRLPDMQRMVHMPQAISGDAESTFVDITVLIPFPFISAQSCVLPISRYGTDHYRPATSGSHIRRAWQLAINWQRKWLKDKQASSAPLDTAHAHKESGVGTVQQLSLLLHSSHTWLDSSEHQRQLRDKTTSTLFPLMHFRFDTSSYLWSCVESA